MTLSLAKFLVESKQISPDRMDDILQRQVIFGGSLDTNILELGLLDEQTVTEALGQAYSLPLASPELLARRDPRMLNLFPPRLAEKHQVVPVAMGGRSVFLLSSARIHPLVAEEISFMLSLAVKSYIVCEARLQGFLRSWFNIEIEPRFSALLDKLGKFDLGMPGRQIGPQTPEALETELQQPATTTVDQAKVDKVMNDIEQEERDESTRREQARTGRIMIDEATRLCMQAPDRDTIIDTTLRFTRQISSFVALFVINNDSILGWDGVGAEDATERIKKIRLPVGSSSILNTVIQTRAYYLGPIPESLGNNELLRALGRARPPNAFAVPLTLKNRLIGLLYGDGGNRSIRGNRLVELLVFISRLSAAFEQLIIKRKSASGLVRKRTTVDLPAVKPRAEALKLAEQAALSSIAGSHGARSESEPAADVPVPAAAASPPPSEESFPLPAPAPLSHAEEEPVVVDESFIDGLSAEGFQTPEAADDNVVVVMDTETDFVPSSPAPAADAPPVLRESEPDVDQPAPAAGGPGPMVVETAPAFDESPSAPGAPVVTADQHAAVITEPAPGEAVETGTLTVEPPSVQLAEDAFSDSVITQPEIPAADYIEQLCRDLVGPERPKAESACDALIAAGRAAVGPLMEHFPGVLVFDIRGAYDSVPPLPEHGLLLKALIEIGQPAGPAVAGRLEDSNLLVRYYAVRLLGEIHCPEFVTRLSERLYDRDPLIRMAAVDTLLEYRKTPVFGRLLASLRSKLKDEDPSQRAIAAALLGNFKDCDALPLLAPLVKASQKMVSRAAIESLSYITKQDFGTSERKWIKWWKTNKGQLRVQWLIAGLHSKNRDIRFSSAQELNQITGEYFDYYYDSGKSDRDRAIKQIEKWWEEKGRYLHFDD